ncbi:MAG: YibE/F family protein [Rikenellaceae bacterium]
MKRKRDLYFTLLVAVVVVILLLLPTGYENPELTRNMLYEKAEVTKVDNSDISEITIVTLGTQELELRILSGKFKGEVVAARNQLLGDKRRDKIFERGDKVLSISRMDEAHEKILETRADEFYRQDLELLLLAIFVVALILLAGMSGAKAALSFIFTALAFWKLLIPALLAGYSPLFISIGVTFVATSVIILLVAGLTKKGAVALFGALSGVVVTALLALIFGHFFKIPGTIQEYSDSLLYLGFEDLNFSQMLLSCIFISSAGAVMDVAMDIAAAQDELSQKASHLSRKELIQSGLNIASPVVGSMTTTLLFAYSGSFMFAFMAYMAQGVPMECIVNRGYIASEILLTMVGSFGLVLVAPITALLGGYIYRSSQK